MRAQLAQFAGSTQRLSRRGAALVRLTPALCLTAGTIVTAALSMGSMTGDTDALPPVPFPAENPFSEPKRVLGKILFFDEQLSSDNTVACATCHTVSAKGSDLRRQRHPGVDNVLNTPDDVFGSPGVVRQTSADDYQRDPVFNLSTRATNRSAQSVVNAAYSPLQFWDGRAGGTFIDPETNQVAIAQGGALESQAVGPPLNDVEMAHAGRDWAQITAKLAGARPLAVAIDLPPDVAAVLQSNPSYPQLFAAAFGDGAITARRIAFAIATYERTLVADQTDWDAFQAGNPGSMTPQEQRGFQEMQAHNCLVCHTPPMFTNTQPTPPGQPPVPVGAMFRNLGLRPPGDDPGRRLVTNNPGDDRRFKVPGLRNVGLKNSFMHTGQFTTLPQVLNFYANGQQQFLPRDPLLPIPMSPQDRADIVAFLAGALTDARVQNGEFPFDAPTLFSQRIGDHLLQVGAGVPGAGGSVPQWIASIPPNIGNAGFKVGVQGGIVGAPASLHISFTPPVNDVVAPDQVIGPVALEDGGPLARGYATAKWPIPSNPALDGRVVWMQWSVQDPAAPGGAALSRPLRVTIFCGTGTCAGQCYANCDGSAGSPALTPADFVCFLNTFRAGDTYANCDGSTGNPALTPADFVCFLAAYRAGCP